MDLVDLYRRTVAEFIRRLPASASLAWQADTPCAGWTTRDLVNHVVGEERWVIPLFHGATIAEVGDRFDGDLLGPDPVVAAGSAATDSIEAVSEPGAVDRTVHLSFGDTPAGEYVWQLSADHLIHAWDLAAATGGDRTLDAELVDTVAAWFVHREDAYRQGGAIGARVDLPAQAGPQDHLLAAFGRDPAWTTSGGDLTA